VFDNNKNVAKAAGFWKCSSDSITFSMLPLSGEVEERGPRGEVGGSYYIPFALNCF